MGARSDAWLRNRVLARPVDRASLAAELPRVHGRDFTMDKRKILGATACALLAAIVSIDRTHAVGPVDVELGALYWGSSTDDGVANENSAAPGAFGNIWLKNSLGFGASYYDVAPEGSLSGTDEDFTTVDVRWRWLSASRNNFIALGVGAERVGIVDDATTAPRVSVEGRVSVKIVYFFARGAYLPTLGSLSIQGLPYDGRTGYELEGGLAVKPAAFISIYAAYKSNKIDLTGPTGDVSLTSSGPAAGLVFSF
jgi:hypothetical protein